MTLFILQAIPNFVFFPDQQERGKYSRAQQKKLSAAIFCLDFQSFSPSFFIFFPETGSDKGKVSFQRTEENGGETFDVMEERDFLWEINFRFESDWLPSEEKMGRKS